VNMNPKHCKTLRNTSSDKPLKISRPIGKANKEGSCGALVEYLVGNLKIISSEGHKSAPHLCTHFAPESGQESGGYSASKAKFVRRS
jgi:hypothetical protein